MDPEELLIKIKNRRHRNAFPDKAESEVLARALQERYGIDNFFLGAKQQSGKLNRRLSCVCLVDKKAAPEALIKAGKTPLPKNISYKFNGKLKRLPIDVVECDTELEFQAIVNPGDQISEASGELFGTVGLLLEHQDYGAVVTTAGHLIQSFDRQGVAEGDIF